MNEEQQWIDAARRGDQAAFEQLVRRYEKRVFALTGRMCRNPSDAEEAAQETFLAAWQGLPFFRGEASFATWLYRLASNACIDFLRREKRRQSLSMTVSLDDDEEERQVELPDERYAPEGELERSEARRAVAEGLERLTAEHRQVLVMRELNGLSYAEIGAVLGLEEGTVKSRIARARNALRKVLTEQGNFFSERSSRK